MKLIKNGKLILPSENGNFKVTTDKIILFDDMIRGILPTDSVNEKEFEEVVDAEGNYISPGFMNVHIHGCFGFDTMDEATDSESDFGSLSALRGMQKYLPETGVTSFLPTTMTMPMKSVRNALGRIRRGMSSAGGARILGANVEGPFISRKFKGAQNEKFIMSANFEEIADFADVVKIITIAPEELKDCDFVGACQSKGIIVSIGHSAANYDVAMNAIKNLGIKHITHLFNAQTGLHHREPSIVGAAFDSDAIVELICDNVHVHPAVQRLVWKVKPKEQIVLITDSLRACGLSDGTYELGGQEFRLEGMIAKLSDGTIAGSAAKMNQVVKNFKENCQIGVAETVELVTKNPAVELGIYDRLGSLEVGKLADIVVFDEGFNIKSTFVEGVAC